MKAMNSRGVQKAARVDLRLDEKLAALVGEELASVSKAQIVVAGLDHETAARLDHVAEIRIRSLAPLHDGRPRIELPLDPPAHPFQEPVN